MSAARRGAVFALSVATVAVVGVQGIRAIRAPRQPRWPGRIALIGLVPDDPRQPVGFLGVADPARRAVVVVPPIAVVEIPGTGFLRAYHSYRLGASPLVRSTLGGLFGVDVPFSATGNGKDLLRTIQTVTSANFPRRHADDFRDALREAGDWSVKDVVGQRSEGVRGPFLIPDRVSVETAARSIGGLGSRVVAGSAGSLAAAPSPSPAATPSTPPRPIPAADITVDVLNGGQVELAATKTAAKLKTKGYLVKKIGDFLPQTRPESVVYFRPGAEAKARQVGAELGYGVEPLPAGIKTDAEVLVLLGNNARVG